jgi:NAD+ synthase
MRTSAIRNIIFTARRILKGMASVVPKITEKDVDSLIRRVRGAVDGTEGNGVVIGLSGGLDSAVTAKICVLALGPEKVMCVFMPSHATPAEDHRITKKLSAEWGTGYTVSDVRAATDSLSAISGGDVTPQSVGNITARCRMAVLYDIAKKQRKLVAGTTNKSEYSIGYFTKFGDGACDISPLSEYYKTQIMQIAKIVGIPDEITDKKPSAGLWEGQTDEGEIGMPYSRLDEILYLIERNTSVKEIKDITGATPGEISSVRNMIDSSGHKRKMPIRP